MKILLEIVLREIELFRSGTPLPHVDLNQMINLQLLKVIMAFHLKALSHKRTDVQAIVSEIATLGPLQNREIAQEICVLIG